MPRRHLREKRIDSASAGRRYHDLPQSVIDGHRRAEDKRFFAMRRRLAGRRAGGVDERSCAAHYFRRVDNHPHW